MTEHGRGGELPCRPHDETEDEQMVAGLAGRQQAVDDEIDPRLDGGTCGRRVLGGERCLWLEDVTDEERHDQCGEDRSNDMGDPAIPAGFRPDEPGQDAENGRPCQEVRPVAPPEDPGRIVDRPGRRDRHERDEHEGQPALGRCERDS